jgi:hypothetical protein
MLKSERESSWNPGDLKRFGVGTSRLFREQIRAPLYTPCSENIDIGKSKGINRNGKKKSKKCRDNNIQNTYARS